jgi:iron(III) transport system substrate-binding protein
VFWPDQDDRGVHINISGVGVTRHAKHREQAITLLEVLSSTEAQNL